MPAKIDPVLSSEKPWAPDHKALLERFPSAYRFLLLMRPRKFDGGLWNFTIGFQHPAVREVSGYR
jgi:hypothetical protein